MTAFEVLCGILAVADAVCLIAVAAHFGRRVTALERWMTQKPKSNK